MEWLRLAGTKAHRTGSRPASARPTLESLEDRRLLATCHVVRLGDFGAGADLGGGHSRGDLRYCINKANDLPGHDTIDINATGTINLTGPLPDLTSDMDIVGPGSAALTVRRNTGGNYRIFTVDSGAHVLLRGVSVANGLVKEDAGGGIFNRGTLTLDDTRIFGHQVFNVAANGNAKGGGIYNEGTLTISRTSITSNTSFYQPASGGSSSAYGGGVYNSGTLTISDSTLSANDAEAYGSYAAFSYGGGIYNAGMLTVSNSTLSQNFSRAYGGHDLTEPGISRGGGIYNGGSTLIEGSTIANNTSEASAYWPDAYGGGISNSGPLTITNSTVSGNEAGAGASGDAEPCAYSGGIHNDSSTLTIDNSTIANNKALTTLCGGYGITVGGSAIITHSTIAGNSNGGIKISGSLTLRNSIVAKNGFDISGTIASSGYNLIGYSGGGSGYVPSDILNVDPLLGPLQDNGGPTLTRALLPGSPAIDSGLNQGAPEWDQRGPGFPRIVNGTIDRGAFEVQATEAPVPWSDLAVLMTADLDADEGMTG